MTRALRRDASTPIAYSAGTISRVTKKAQNTPNTSETTIGIRNLACMERSIIIGIRPTMVVAVVSMIGRKRTTPASTIASSAPMPFSRRRLV